MGQFERTLIIADEGSYVHYVEGCTAPIYSTDSLHSGVVEIFVEPHARVRYTTVQNWSNNVYNLVTQRAYVREGGTMEWVDGNIGSKGHHEVSGIHARRAVREGQHHVVGLRRQGPISGHGREDDSPRPEHQLHHRGEVDFPWRRPFRIPWPRQNRQGRGRVLNSTVCDALLVDEFSRSDTYPHVDVREDNVSMAHEATVSKVSKTSCSI